MKLVNELNRMTPKIMTMFFFCFFFIKIVKES